MSYQTERSNYFKSTHRCYRCGKKDERTESGSTLCFACKEYLKAARKKYYDSHIDKVRATMRERSKFLKAQGICTVCGKEKAIEGMTRCESCREKNLIYQRKAYLKKVMANG